MNKLTIGLSLSLSGRYAAFGTQAEKALQLFVATQNSAGGIKVDGARLELALRCHDDASEPARCAEIYRGLCSDSRIAILLGPYSSALTRVAAPIAEEAGRVLVNHGGAADDLYERGYRWIVGVPAPASDYFAGLATLLAGLKFWRKRVAIVASATPFARAVAEGFERACVERPVRRRGVRIRLKRMFEPTSERRLEPLIGDLVGLRINALVGAGSFEEDVALMRALVGLEVNIPVLACVAAGVREFYDQLGELGEGIIGPSQWDEQLQLAPEIGPAPRDFAAWMRARHPGSPCDYPAAQAYAAGLLALTALARAGGFEQSRIREAFSELRVRTFYGDFAIDRVSGRQIGHKVLLVQWHNGERIIIHPEAHADIGALEFPSGWRLILASLRSLKLSSRRGEDDGDKED